MSTLKVNSIIPIAGVATGQGGGVIEASNPESVKLVLVVDVLSDL